MNVPVFKLGIFVCMLSSVLSTCTTKLCRDGGKVKYASSGVFKKKLKLNVTSIASVKVTSIAACQRACIKNQECFSVNGIQINSSTIECSLLGTQAYTNKNKFIAQANSTHITIWNSGCAKSDCQNNSTCVPNYDDDTSTCKCLEGFEGTKCETPVIGKVTVIHYNIAGTYEAFIRHQDFMKVTSTSGCLAETYNGYPYYYSGHVFAYFPVTKSGKHAFTMYCAGACRFYVSIVGQANSRKLFLADVTLAGWGTFSDDVYFMSGMKLFLENVARGTDQSHVSSQMGFGIRLPDGIELKPITNKLLSHS